MRARSSSEFGRPCNQHVIAAEDRDQTREGNAKPLAVCLPLHPAVSNVRFQLGRRGV